jgi:hypothetical protein
MTVHTQGNGRSGGEDRGGTWAAHNRPSAPNAGLPPDATRHPAWHLKVPETRSALSRCGFVLADEAAEQVPAPNMVEIDLGL